MKKIDIIYNTTLICPWDCEICCVDAIQVKRGNGGIVSKSEGLSLESTISTNSRYENSFEVVYEDRKRKGLELSLSQKVQLIENLEGFDARLDISGGDPLTINENYEFLKFASNKLGKHNLTLTATGRGLAKVKPKDLAPYISEYNFTYDALEVSNIVGRPIGYADSNFFFAKKMVQLGCSTRAEFPMNRNSLSREHITGLYMSLHDAKIDKLLLMRLFPVGRGSLRKEDIPTREEYIEAINLFSELEEKYKVPKLKLQCALKHLYPKGNSSNRENPCDLFQASFGLMADGTLLASPWAINSIGKPLSEAWVLGNLYREKLSKILMSKKGIAIRERLDDNFGHCKIFSFLNSSRKDDFDKVFDESDPLYS